MDSNDRRTADVEYWNATRTSDTVEQLARYDFVKQMEFLIRSGDLNKQVSELRELCGANWIRKM